MPRVPALLSFLAAGAAACALVGPARDRPAAATEIVVALRPAALSSGGSAAAIDRAQSRFASALVQRLPGASIRWRYHLVLDGVAVVVRPRDVEALRRLPDVRAVYPSARYEVAAAPGPAGDQIGAPALWGSGLETSGQGVRIGIIDGGVDAGHPFLSPAGLAMPDGYPKGQVAYTTAKVIVARSFPAPGQTGKALLPFDPDASSSEHGTHVAGIAAGDDQTRSPAGLVSGVAPGAYIGNYRALTIPTDGGVGEDGNTAEIVAAIEAAVADGMNVINLSIGEPETEPTRDAIALALDGAARAGVVPVVAAGNDFGEYGRGSLSSPGTSALAITAAAVTTAASGSADVVADFSSAGPTPLSLRLKPDVAAPGVSILSSTPGGWSSFSGTSMATPHVAGAVALLRQRHPDWTVEQLKAALVETGTDAFVDNGHTTRALPDRVGGGVVDLAAADQPLVFASPSSLSLGYVHAGATASAPVSVADAGGGAGDWSVSIDAGEAPAGTTVAAPPAVTVPGSLTLTATAGGQEGDASGWIVLTRNGTVRRIPYWLRVTQPRLGLQPATQLRRPGVYAGNTRGRRNLVSRYRYPDVPPDASITATLAGPEQVYRLVLRRPVANAGVVVLTRGPGVKVEPRVVVGADENRLAGYAGLPVILNPYLASFDLPEPVAGVLLPRAGTYEIVFDSHSAAGAGRFTFRLWVGDTTPPRVTLADRSVARGAPLVARATDAGSGVDPDTVVAKIDGVTRTTGFAGGTITVATDGIRPGRHRLRLQVSDYQETKNMENVAAVLPNTRVVSATITIRR